LIHFYKRSEEWDKCMLGKLSQAVDL